MTKRTVLFPFITTEVGGSIVVPALLTKYINHSTNWRACVCLPWRGRNAALFETDEFTPDYLGVKQLDSSHARHRRYREKIPAYIKTYFLARAYLKELKPDIVHINSSTMFAWELAARQLGIPSVWHLHFEKKTVFDKYQLRLHRHIIFVADAIRHRLGDLGSLPPSSTIYNPVDLTRFHPPQNRDELRAALGLAPDRLIIGFVGNLAPRKRPEWAVQAAIDLLEQGLEIQLIVIGDDYSKDGAYEKELRHMIEQAGFTEHIHLLGYRADVPELLRTMDVLLLTSVERGEAFPLVIIEAMASSVAVIATRVAGVPEAFKDGVSGLLVSPNSYEELPNALKALVTNAARREEIASHALEEARARYSVETIGEQMLALYDRLLEPSARPSQ